MKTRAWMLFSCCLGLWAPLSTARAEEQPQGFVKITVGVEGEGLERIPVVGPLLQQLVDSQKEPCAEQEQEQVKLPPPPTECPKCANHERGVPILDKIPYVSRLFKNVGVGHVSEECEVEVVECPAPKTVRWIAPDGLERIGVDFDCEVVEQCAQCQAKRCAVTNAARATAVCPPANEWKPIAVPPPANCPPVAVCPPPGAYAVQACEVLPAPFAVMQQPQGVASRDELIEALMEARVEAAVAQTALKVREESEAKQLELIKELVTSQVENAKLTAKLELAAEKEKLLAQLIEGHVELATLKAQVGRETEVAHRKRQKTKPDRVPEPPAEMLR
jgi:hypothetical protein